MTTPDLTGDTRDRDDRHAGRRRILHVPDGSSAIDDHILGMTGRSRPRVCFVPTASGDADSYSERFEAAFAGRAETSVLSLFCREPWGYSDPQVLLDQGVIYVGGGSTANLLAVWRLHGLPSVLQ